VCFEWITICIHPYNSSNKFLILIWILPQFPTSEPSAWFQLNPMKHKIVIEIPPYYIDTLGKWVNLVSSTSTMLATEVGGHAVSCHLSILCFLLCLLRVVATTKKKANFPHLLVVIVYTSSKFCLLPSSSNFAYLPPWHYH
jgi:hypothetical protein